jgi:hypothetical protein
MSNSFLVIPMTVLATVGGGRKSSSSTEEIKTLLTQTGEAIKDLARSSQKSSSSDQMMPMMMMMMMRK